MSKTITWVHIGDLHADPADGWLGIDRLVMLFTGAGIRETILFPLLKPGAPE